MSAKTQFCFQVDGRGSKWVDSWEEAASDAVGAGYAHWVRGGTAIKLDDGQGAAIARRTVNVAERCPVTNKTCESEWLCAQAGCEAKRSAA